MLITYLRSSSIGAYEWCPHKYFLTYALGLPDVSGKKAVKGSCVHKALEILARKKWAEQKEEEIVIDSEMGVRWPIEDITPDNAIEWAIAHYKQDSWDHLDIRDIRKWTYEVLTWRDGTFSPLQREIVAPEQYFDITLEFPWANYDYLLADGTKISGKFAIRGTMDLITRVSPGVLEYVDYKTGRRLNWNTGKEKGWEDLTKDKQFLLYYYALKHLYPDDEIIFTVYYIQDGGPYTICFGPEHLKQAEKMLETYFTRIKNDKRPRLIYPSWKCERLCHYHKTEHPDSGKTVCQHFKDELISLGMDRVVMKHADLSRATAYTEGGGRVHV